MHSAPRLKRLQLDTLACTTVPVAGEASFVEGRARIVTREGLVRASTANPQGARPTVNGAVLLGERALSHGDVVNTGPCLLVLLETPEARDAALEAAVLARPGEATPALVYADWLAERGDPFGAHIVTRSRSLPSRETGLLEGLWLDVARGVVHLDWRQGLVHGATLRAGEGTEPWPVLLAELLTLRVAFTLRELRLDVPGLVRERGVPLTAQAIEGGAKLALRLIAASPVARQLEHLVLGYGLEGHLTVELPRLDAADSAKELPSLSAGPLFHRVGAAWLAVEAAQGEPGRVGERLELTQPMTLKGQTLVGPWPLSPMRRAETFARLSSITQREGAWVLQVAGGEPAVRLNGARVEEAALLPGDLVSVDDRVSLRFVVDS